MKSYIRHLYAIVALVALPIIYAFAQVPPSVFTGCNVRTVVALPTFTNLQTSALNCNERGALRVDVTGFTSQAGINLFSGTITTGGSFQTVITGNSGRRNCLIQNPVTGSGVLYVYLGTAGSGTAAQSISLAPGMTFNCASPSVVYTNEVALMHATTGFSFIAMSN